MEPKDRQTPPDARARRLSRLADRALPTELAGLIEADKSASVNATDRGRGTSVDPAGPRIGRAARVGVRV